jgi:hypothetical protein
MIALRAREVVYSLAMLVDRAFVVEKAITLPAVSVFGGFLVLFEGFFATEQPVAVWTRNVTHCVPMVSDPDAEKPTQWDGNSRVVQTSYV